MYKLCFSFFSKLSRGKILHDKTLLTEERHRIPTLARTTTARSRGSAFSKDPLGNCHFWPSRHTYPVQKSPLLIIICGHGGAVPSVREHGLPVHGRLIKRSSIIVQLCRLINPPAIMSSPLLSLYLAFLLLPPRLVPPLPSLPLFVRLPPAEEELDRALSAVSITYER